MNPSQRNHPGPFPPTLEQSPPFLADLDTTDGLGSPISGRLVSSVTQLAAECVQRGFPEVSFNSSAVVVTWESVAPYQGPSKDPTLEGKVSTHQAQGQIVSMRWLCTLWSSGLCYSHVHHIHVIGKDRTSTAKSNKLFIAGLKCPKSYLQAT